MRSRPAPTRWRSRPRPSRRGWTCSDSSPASFIGNPDCTPGYYNNEGQPLNARARFAMAGYPLGPVAYFEYIDKWRNSGDFDGLEFRTR